ncbi:hypothetical protein CONLIGDRAFT_143136 [Coniochaeta ligniaria NRRL 30616]|uniref:Uncharacterized protein n=1 Tax=Coniochaeta ligniaria NRRL 30616 TaxID=1408157 RepID=A0A1J7I6S0_9PEZI|nr:hypothetical protein CONLIGDRAFT_143136 [Coniochaeta ligniaria NRRL 30616]
MGKQQPRRLSASVQITPKKATSASPTSRLSTTSTTPSRQPPHQQSLPRLPLPENEYEHTSMSCWHSVGCYTAIPHREVDAAEFYKHIGGGSAESGRRRARATIPVWLLPAT